MPGRQNTGRQTDDLLVPGGPLRVDHLGNRGQIPLEVTLAQSDEGLFPVLQRGKPFAVQLAEEGQGRGRSDPSQGPDRFDPDLPGRVVLGLVDQDLDRSARIRIGEGLGGGGPHPFVGVPQALVQEGFDFRHAEARQAGGGVDFDQAVLLAKQLLQGCDGPPVPDLPEGDGSVHAPRALGAAVLHHLDQRFDRRAVLELAQGQNDPRLETLRVFRVCQLLEQQLASGGGAELPQCCQRALDDPQVRSAALPICDQPAKLRLQFRGADGRKVADYSAAQLRVLQLFVANQHQGRLLSRADALPAQQLQNRRAHVGVQALLEDRDELPVQGALAGISEPLQNPEDLRVDSETQYLPPLIDQGRVARL